MAAQPEMTQTQPAERLLALVESFVRETRPSRAPRVTLDSPLESDLGIDSLGRAELLLRTERAFGIALPERALNEIDTPRDLLRFVLASPVPRAPLSPQAPYSPQTPAPTRVQGLAVPAGAGVPSGARTLLEMIDWHL